MHIRILPIGLVKQFVHEHEMEAEPGLTPRWLIIALGIPSELKMISLVNGTKTDLDQELHDGGEVKLVTLAAGG